VPPPVFKPDIVFPSDPNLQGREAKVWVKVLVNTKGIVRDAQIIKSTDAAFNKYALKYAKQYKFKFEDGFGKFNQLWISIPIVFKQ
jgi:TonB family protein